MDQETHVHWYYQHKKYSYELMKAGKVHAAVSQHDAAMVHFRMLWPEYAAHALASWAAYHEREEL